MRKRFSLVVCAIFVALFFVSPKPTFADCYNGAYLMNGRCVALNSGGFDNCTVSCFGRSWIVYCDSHYCEGQVETNTCVNNGGRCDRANASLPQPARHVTNDGNSAPLCTNLNGDNHSDACVGGGGDYFCGVEYADFSNPSSPTFRCGLYRRDACGCGKNDTANADAGGCRSGDDLKNNCNSTKDWFNGGVGCRWYGLTECGAGEACAVLTHGTCGTGGCLTACGDSIATVACSIACPDNSTCVSTSGLTPMFLGETRSVSATMMNSGFTTSWVTPAYQLGSYLNNTVWGTTRSALPSSPIAPNGTNAIFNFNITAPTTVGNYEGRWQMVNGSTAFGATCGPTTIAVVDTCTVTITKTERPFDTGDLDISQTIQLDSNTPSTQLTFANISIGTHTFLSSIPTGYKVSHVLDNDQENTDNPVTIICGVGHPISHTINWYYTQPSTSYFQTSGGDVTSGGTITDTNLPNGLYVSKKSN